MKNPQPMREENRTIPCVRMGNSSSYVEMGKKTQWNTVVNGIMESQESGENGKIASMPMRHEDEESAGGLDTWERTDSPTTPTTTQQ